MDNLQVLYTALVADVPLVIWGPPGVGKTATIEALGPALGKEVVTIIGAVRDRTDFEGFPVFRERNPEGGVLEARVDLFPQPWLKRLIELGDDGILFLDEINADERIFPVLMRVLAERHVGSFRIRSRILAAGNPAEISVSGLDLPPVVANRLIHYHWNTDDGMEGWLRWMNGDPEGAVRISNLPMVPTQEALEGHVRAAKSLVASYLRRNPSHVLGDPKRLEGGGPWPSFRSWTLAAQFMGAAMALGFGLGVQATGVVGAVGEGAGRPFIQWLKDLDLPEPEKVLEDPSLMPKRPDAVLATMNAVAQYVARQPSQEMWDRFWKVAEVAAKSGHKDLVAEAARIVAIAFEPHSSKMNLEFSPLARDLVMWAAKIQARRK